MRGEAQVLGSVHHTLATTPVFQAAHPVGEHLATHSASCSKHSASGVPLRSSATNCTTPQRAWEPARETSSGSNALPPCLVTVTWASSCAPAGIVDIPG